MKLNLPCFIHQILIKQSASLACILGRKRRMKRDHFRKKKENEKRSLFYVRDHHEFLVYKIS